jgi:ornithine decarboxylase
LNEKFGVEEERAIELLAYAKEMGLKPYGITFHVGSQCMELSNWAEAIERSRLVWESARKRGVELSMLNIGGGFPVRYTTPVHSIADIAKVVKDALRKNLPQDIEIVAEPGRYLVAEAGILVATVIAKAVRKGQKWLYLDAGVFNSLMESLGGIRYHLAVQRNAPPSKWVVAGPSCDGLDVICKEVELPELEVGDKVYIMSAGAYTTAYASEFNGFPIPRTYFI